MAQIQSRVHRVWVSVALTTTPEDVRHLMNLGGSKLQYCSFEDRLSKSCSSNLTSKDGKPFDILNEGVKEDTHGGEAIEGEAFSHAVRSAAGYTVRQHSNSEK